ncbi:MAG: hypothetical protein ABEJ91_01610 [Candidatus Nanohaloarchaea archaeon]
MGLTNALSGLVENAVAFVVMILLGIVSFFVTVFVVQAGSGLAGYSGATAPSADFVVLSSALIVTASIIAGAMK